MWFRKGILGRMVMIILGAVLGVFCLLTIIHQQGLGASWEAVEGFGWWMFLGFVGISLLNFVLYSCRWSLILRRQLPARVAMPSLWSMYWHRMAGYAAGYLTPLNQAGGEPVRVALLIHDGVPGKSAVASVTLDLAFELCSSVVFVAVGVAFALAEHYGEARTLTVMVLGLTVAFGGLMMFFMALSRNIPITRPLFSWLRLDRVARLRSVEAWLEAMEQIMRQFFAHGTATVASVAGLSLCMVAFRVLETLYIAWGFGVSLHGAQAFLISSVPGLALILPIPGGIGLFESGFAAVFTALAVPMNPLAFALIIRLRDGVFMILGFLHMLRTGTAWALRRSKKGYAGS